MYVCVCADSSSQPKVTFPRSLLGPAHQANLSSVTAYLTVPQRHLLKDCTHCVPALVPAASGERRDEEKEEEEKAPPLVEGRGEY